MLVEFMDGTVRLKGKQPRKGLIFKIYFQIDDKKEVVYKLFNEIGGKRVGDETVIIVPCKEKSKEIHSLAKEKISDFISLLESKISKKVVSIPFEVSDSVAIRRFSRQGSRSGSFSIPY
jgi:hypothetical protein